MKNAKRRAKRRALLSFRQLARESGVSLPVVTLAVDSGAFPPGAIGTDSSGRRRIEDPKKARKAMATYLKSPPKLGRPRGEPANPELLARINPLDRQTWPRVDEAGASDAMSIIREYWAAVAAMGKADRLEAELMTIEQLRADVRDASALIQDHLRRIPDAVIEGLRALPDTNQKSVDAVRQTMAAVIERSLHGLAGALVDAGKAKTT